MAQKKIHIVWQNGRTIDIRLEDNPVAEFYYGCIKYLQHVNLQFDARKNPLQAKQTTVEIVTDDLIRSALALNLSVDIGRLSDQQYLNELHSIYFDNARQPKFDQQWLKFHDSIHLLEDFYGRGLIPRTNIWFDYEDKAGPLIKPFNREWLKYSTTDILAGMCFLREQELGKAPSLYWHHNEPLDAQTICAQSKPWLLLKPVLNVAILNNNNYDNFDEEKFNQWFAPLRETWCKHWSVPDWTPKEIFLGIPVGTVDDLPELIKCFSNLDYPQRLAL